MCWAALWQPYFVVTAVTTVRPASACTRGLNWTALLVVIALSVIDIVPVFKAFTSPDGMIDGVPLFMLFFMATITALAAVSDVRMLLLGTLPAVPPLARHVWRMSFALFIAAGLFFSIRKRVAKILPGPFHLPFLIFNPRSQMVGWAIRANCWLGRRLQI
jgi:hypothetical protein